MQALKALVIFMGILIAAGVAVLGVTIYNRATKMAAGDKPASSAASTPPLASAPQGASGPQVPSSPPASGAAATKFGVRELGLPTGSSIVSVQLLGARVLVHARLPDGATRILLLDPATGDVAGEWRASGTPAPTQAPVQSPAGEGGGRP